MLKHQQISERVYRAKIEGGLLPSVTLLDDLVKFLNNTRTKRGKQIVEVLRLMLEIEEMAKPIKGLLWPDLSLRKTSPAKFALLCEIDNKVHVLRKQMELFKFIPRAEVAVGGGGADSEWATWWTHDDYSDADKSRFRVGPTEALEIILRLTGIGSLSRLRICRECGTWLYAKFRHQNFCCVTCQQKNYTHSENWREHRRKYMRNYYHTVYGRTRPKKNRIKSSK